VARQQRNAASCNATQHSRKKSVFFCLFSSLWVGLGEGGGVPSAIVPCAIGVGVKV
jgi:hypothetical protein